MNPSLSERTRVKGGAGQGGDKGRGEGAGRRGGAIAYK